MPGRVRLWLDDVRPAPEGWVRTRTVQETIERIERGDVAEVSLDHDLELTDPYRKGADVADWIRLRAAQGHPVPVVHVHTANPIGGARMAATRQASEAETGTWARQFDRAKRTIRRKVFPPR